MVDTAAAEARFFCQYDRARRGVTHPARLIPRPALENAEAIVPANGSNAMKNDGGR